MCVVIGKEAAAVNLLRGASIFFHDPFEKLIFQLFLNIKKCSVVDI